MTNFFTADTHFGHDNIIRKEYCDRPFASGREMDHEMIRRWNEVVTPGDTVYHLGDFAFGRRSSERGFMVNILDQLNGKKILIAGSHDSHLLKDPEAIKRFQYVYPTANRSYPIAVILVPDADAPGGKLTLVLSHYAMVVWPHRHKGAWHLFGHCLDNQTEILTQSGWKQRKDLSLGDRVITLNTTSGRLEYNKINEFVDHDYTGEVINIQSKGLDLRVTTNHVLIEQNRGTSSRHATFSKFLAKDIDRIQRRTLVKSGHIKADFCDSINDCDEVLRLLVWIAADGNICNTNLARIRVFKNRKIRRLVRLLQQLDIDYKIRPQKDGSTSINFNIPDALNRYRWKPLDEAIKYCNHRQIAVVVDEYTHTDGQRIGNSKLIYTSKKEEADILQIACVTHGYSCNITTRENQGFSDKPNYQLCITNNTTRDVTKLSQRINREHVENEPFWCVKVQNQTIMVRRNGKPTIVGNSHGRCDDARYLSLDIGVDCHNFYPLSFDDMRLAMWRFWSPDERKKRYANS